MCIKTVTITECAICDDPMQQSETTTACPTVTKQKANFGDCTGKIRAGKTIRRYGLCCKEECHKLMAGCEAEQMAQLEAREAAEVKWGVEEEADGRGDD